MREHFRDFENLIDAQDNSDQNKEYQLFNLLVSFTPRGEMFIGKHGTGLMTITEFETLLDEAYLSDKLAYQSYSAAHLNESIDFGKDAA